MTHFNPLIANPTKWPNTLKQFVGKLLSNCLSVFDHFVKVALKGLRHGQRRIIRKMNYPFMFIGTTITSLYR